MRGMRAFWFPVFLTIFFSSCNAILVTETFDKCLSLVQNRGNSSLDIGVVYNNGTPVTGVMAGCNETQPFCAATAISYELCLSECGPDQESFSWEVFAEQFGAWLLPWLALLSQLPFGAWDRPDNLMSVLLTVGSPAFAAYSLALTVLNSHWLATIMSPVHYPNVDKAYTALSSLQQSFLRLNREKSVLASLIILPKNDLYWESLVEGLQYTHTWSISSITNLLWVIVAYVFTVINAFNLNVNDALNSNGQAVGSLWLWLPAVVVGWLQISPKCDSRRVEQAVNQSNKLAYVAGEGPHDSPSPPQRVVTLTNISPAISLYQGNQDALFNDMSCTIPIFNYARVFHWAETVERVVEGYSMASIRMEHRETMNERWDHDVLDNNRQGTQLQLETYLRRDKRLPRTRNEVWRRIVVASCAGLTLQWATTGSAVVIVWYTPTTGLGCRSGAYIIYGALATIVWAMMLLSSLLTHWAIQAPIHINQREGHELAEIKLAPRLSRISAHSGNPVMNHIHIQLDTAPPSSIATGPQSQEHSSAPSVAEERPFDGSRADEEQHIRGPAVHPLDKDAELRITRPALRTLALTLRRIAKFIATLNTIGVLVTSIFQFTNFFNRCYCNSSVTSRGRLYGYDVMKLLPEDHTHLINSWKGGIILSAATAILFVFAVNLWINPPVPGGSSR